MKNVPSWVKFSEEVAQALSENKAVVALESSVWCQGLPKPFNLETAQEMERSQEMRSIQADKNSMAKLVQNGMTVSGMSDEFQKACAALAKPIWAEWVKKVGPEGAQIIDEFTELTGK